MSTSRLTTSATIFCCLLACRFVVSSRELLEPSTPESHLPLAECALQMTQRFLSTKSKTILVKENCFRCESVQEHFNKRLLDYLLWNFGPRLSIQLYMANEQPWNYNLFIVNNALAFDLLSFGVPDSLYERNFRFLIVLTDNKFPDEEQRQSVMRRIFTTCLKLRVLNVVLMMEERDNSIAFYTFHIYEQSCSQDVSITEVNRYRDGDLQHNYLFPPRPRDFHECPLRISGYVLPPMLSFDGDIRNEEHLGDMQRLSGFEGELLKLLAEVLNFRIKLSLHREKSVVSDKLILTSYFKELYYGNADMAIGGLSASDPSHAMFTTSTSYQHNPFVLVIRSRPRYGPIEILASAYDTPVWLCIGLCFLVAMRIIKAFQSFGSSASRAFVFGNRNSSPLTNMFSICVGNPVNRVPGRNFARFLITWWTLGAVVLRCGYQAKIFEALRISRELRLPHNLNKVVDNKYLLLTSTLYDFYPKNQSVLVKSNFSQRFDMLEKRSDKFVALSLLDNLVYYKEQERNRDSPLRYIKEPVYTQQQVMYFAKHSILRTPFDHKLMQLVDAGITSHLAKKQFRRGVQIVKGGDGEQKASPITNDDFEGVYVVFMALMGLATLCFCMELLTARTRWRICGRWRICLEASHNAQY